MGQAAVASSPKKGAPRGRAKPTNRGSKSKRSGAKRTAPKGKKRSTGKQPQRRRAEDRRGEALRNEVLGIGILAASLCAMLALASFTPEDVSLNGIASQTGQTQNLIGPVGASIADILLYIFGAAAFLLPVTLAIPGVYFLTGRRLSLKVSDAVGYPILVFFSAMAAHLWLTGRPVLGHDAGGMIGAYGAEILHALFGLTGAYILVYSVIALTFVMTTRISLVRFFGRGTRPIARVAVTATSGVKSQAETTREGLGERFGELGSDLGAWWADRAEQRQASRLAKREARAEARAVRQDRRDTPAEIGFDEPDVIEEPNDIEEPRKKTKRSKRQARPEPRPLIDSGPYSLGTMTEAKPEPATSVRPVVAEPAVVEFEYDLPDTSDTVLAPALTEADFPTPDALPAVAPEESFADLFDDAPQAVLAPEQPVQVAKPEPAVESKPEAAKPVVKARIDEPEQIVIPLPEDQTYNGYRVPSIHMLANASGSKVEVDPLFLQEQAERLVEALHTFKVDGRVTEIHPGPVVTMFEFEPSPGTRISRISKLADDLAMALKAIKVRIVAPIPGKGVVGFEVPNAKRETVYLKEIIHSKAFANKSLKLPMALGKDIHGRPAVTDLAKMPHLLVAGTTGSGKSVGVNSMIVSLLYRYGPEDVRFIMVDPKMLELSIYEGIPHLLLPVVTDSKKASLALKWAVDEMERRYAMMKDVGVRDIGGYNRKVEKLAAEAEANQLRAQADALELGEDEVLHIVDEPEPLRKVPYIVVVIDEFADLMMVAGKEVEHSVARIAQKARAAGIHLILATQRPSTDVITGVIKANFPTRLAFRVSSGIDSRTILSTNGAENLLGRGDMLFLPPGTSSLTRVHGALVTEEEIHEIVSFISAQQEPEYLDESILEEPTEEDKGGDGDDRDSMYEEAVRTIFRDGRASTSHLQRRLSLGYNRAARIVDQMERDGLVGPSNGAKPRVVDKAALSELINRWDA